MKKLVLLIVMLLFALPAVAQENVSPLLDLLALVPDNSTSRGDIISYQDLRAVENAIDLPRPESGVAFLASRPSLMFTQRWLGMPPQVSYARNLMEEMPATVGFDFFDINRTLTFAAPPETTVIWSGDFDLDAIAEAHEARGFQASEINGVPALCGADGCDSGTAVSPSNIERGNLFDPALGRQVPFLTLPETLVSSPRLELLEAVADASQGNDSSLLDARDYRTLAEAITDPAAYSGELVSALLLPTDLVLEALDFTDAASLMPLLGQFATPEQLEALVNNPPDFIADYGTLPVYRLAAIADRQDGEWQVAVVALVYNSAEDAEIAAPELAQRLETFSGFLRTQDDEPFLSRFPSTTVESRVYTSDETGFSAAVVEVRYPMPSQEEEQATPDQSSEGAPRFPAAYYRYLVDSIYQRGLYPLWLVEQ